tara:strand:+ start:6011 stop:6829 length:819 start_codon:yes stop_codon:yes gene_type:complete
MTTIIPSLTYSDGAILDTDAHNRNIYTVETSDQGIASVANGGIDNNNMDPSGLTLSPEHIQTEQGVRVRQEFMLESIDCFQDRFGTSDTHTVPATAPGDYWKNVPGCGIRFFLPYKATVLLQWSFFISPYRVMRFDGPYVDGDDTIRGVKTKEAKMLVAARYDSQLLRHTERGVPFSGFFRRPGDPSDIDRITQSSNGLPNKRCVYWDMSHLVQGALAGWHELNLAVYMEKLSASESYTWSSIAGEVVGPTYFMQRLSFGVRSARVLILNTL